MPCRGLGSPIQLKSHLITFVAECVWTLLVWDHVLSYWKDNLEKPQKVFFLKYEEMKEQPTIHLKQLAEFLGCSFSPEEEAKGIVNDIINLCSFNNLSNLEVNKKESKNVNNLGVN